MTENRVAKTLWIIGIVEVVCGVIVGTYILATGDDSGWIGIAIVISCFITCMLFVGFGEIINLLQKNADKQDALLTYLKDLPWKEKSAQESVLQDIESNLPQM